MLQPSPGAINGSKEIDRLSKNFPESHHPIGFLRREPPLGFPALQCRPRNGKLMSQRLERLADLVSQMFQLAEGQALTHTFDYFGGKEIPFRQRSSRSVFPHRLFTDEITPRIAPFCRFAHLGKLNDSNGHVNHAEHPALVRLRDRRRCNRHRRRYRIRKMKAPVSYPTGASAMLRFFASLHLSARGKSKFSKVGRVADFRDDPRLRSERCCWLLRDRPAYRGWPKGDGVTRFCHGNVVLAPVLAEEEPFFTLEQAG